MRYIGFQVSRVFWVFGFAVFWARALAWVSLSFGSWVSQGFWVIGVRRVFAVSTGLVVVGGARWERGLSGFGFEWGDVG